MRTVVFGATGPTGRQLTEQADHPTATRYHVEENVADGLFTARADLAASMVAQLTDHRFVRRAMAVITTQVRPSIAGLIWREAVAKKK
ncbi:hypothetical protein AB0J84_14990 [Micromonospora arborensis]|uniref:hypothetical protein n=1 Tax=Micromonospora arborensis TaxID=2116518 RepID=UPI00341D33FE